MKGAVNASGALAGTQNNEFNGQRLFQAQQVADHMYDWRDEKQDNKIIGIDKGDKACNRI